MFPKIDMASEKAMIEKWTPPEVADGHRGLEGSQEIEVLEERSKNSSEVREGAFWSCPLFRGAFFGVEPSQVLYNVL